MRLGGEIEREREIECHAIGQEARCDSVRGSQAELHSAAEQPASCLGAEPSFAREEVKEAIDSGAGQRQLQVADLGRQQPWARLVARRRGLVGDRRFELEGAGGLGRGRFEKGRPARDGAVLVG